jgi:hypothetical protein
LYYDQEKVSEIKNQQKLFSIFNNFFKENVSEKENKPIWEAMKKYGLL